MTAHEGRVARAVGPTREETERRNPGGSLSGRSPAEVLSRCWEPVDSPSSSQTLAWGSGETSSLFP